MILHPGSSPPLPGLMLFFEVFNDMGLVYGDHIQNLCFSSGSSETYSIDSDYFSDITYPFYSYDDALVSPDKGDEEPENGSEEDSTNSDDSVDNPSDNAEEPEEEPEETVSDNETDPEEEPEESVSDNEADPEESVSDNEADPEESVSDNSASDNSASSNHLVRCPDYDSLSGNIIVVNNDGLTEYMPTVIEILSIIGGLLLAVVVVGLCKYIYKFFRVFF